MLDVLKTKRSLENIDAQNAMRFNERRTDEGITKRKRVQYALSRVADDPQRILYIVPFTKPRQRIAIEYTEQGIGITKEELPCTNCDPMGVSVSD